MSYFPEQYTRSKNKIKVKLDSSNYATIFWLKKCNRCWYFRVAKKTDLAILKSDFDKLGINKLGQVPSGFNRFKSKVDKLDVDKLAPAVITAV